MTVLGMPRTNRIQTLSAQSSAASSQGCLGLERHSRTQFLSRCGLSCVLRPLLRPTENSRTRGPPESIGVKLACSILHCIRSTPATRHPNLLAGSGIPCPDCMCFSGTSSELPTAEVHVNTDTVVGQNFASYLNLDGVRVVGRDTAR